MKRTWANSGLDIHLDLGGRRVRSALEGALRSAARGGRLRAGSRLPSSRALARDLRIARNTVADAYAQLVAEGWLATRLGAGTWVADRPSAAAAHIKAVPTSARLPGFDLRPGVPDLAAFPRSAWLAAARRALAVASPELMGYGFPLGIPQLRVAVADYLARVRGVVVTPERVVICAGFSQGLELLCQVLRARGARSMTVEAYGYRGHQDIIRKTGLRTMALPVDPGGAVIDEIGRTDAVLLTPAHQFPIGVPLDPVRRRRVLEWAAGTRSLIIEDDYDGEFRYDRQPIGAMQALAPEHVVYAGTASKSLVPGLRLAWLVVPAHLVDEFAAHKTKAGAFSSSIEQLTLAEFITSGTFDRQVRHMRLRYRRRRDHLVATLSREVPHIRVTGLAAGLHALLLLAEDHEEATIVKRALNQGVVVEGLAAYASGPGSPPALVVGYARPPEHAFTSAIARLCAALR